MTEAHGLCAGEDPQEVRALVEVQSETSKDMKDAQSHLDQNVLGQLRGSSPGLDSGPPRVGLFSDAGRPCQRPASPLWRKRGTRKSGLETKTENEVRSALLARLW